MSFDAKLRSALTAIHAAPTADEAKAIIDLCRLAAAADRTTDLSETVVMLGLIQTIADMAKLSSVPAPAAISPQRLAQIGELLVPPSARELAYACAFLVIVSDLVITDEERALATALADALQLDATRAATLANDMETLVRAARG